MMLWPPKIGVYLKGRAQGRSAAALASELGIELAGSSLVGVEWNALTYAGHTVWFGMSTTARPKMGIPVARSVHPRGEWYIKKDTHEALITRSETKTLLARLEKGRGRDVTKSDYLLSGLLVSPNGTPCMGTGATTVVTSKTISQEW